MIATVIKRFVQEYRIQQQASAAGERGEENAFARVAQAPACGAVPQPRDARQRASGAVFVLVLVLLLLLVLDPSAGQNDYDYE